MKTTDRLPRLRAVLREMDHVLVTFSGGVDSALVLRVAHEELGPRAVALTAVSPTLPPEEGALAADLARAWGVEHLVVESHELEREGYARNEGDRCYFCKSELFDLARARADARGIRWVVDGTLLDDLGEHRPGLAAASEREVRHPLVEAGFTKAEVRATARALGIPVWDKPSFACLGSRFPAGTRVTLDRLVRVARVESALRAEGLRQFRVRFHALDDAELLRIEVEVSDLELLVRPGVRERLVDRCRQEGFAWITLDLEGYRRGNGSTRPALPSTSPASPTASSASPPARGDGSS